MSELEASIRQNRRLGELPAEWAGAVPCGGRSPGDARAPPPPERMEAGRPWIRQHLVRL